MPLLEAYRLRLRRKRFLVRAFRKGRELTPVALRRGRSGPDAILLFACIRNEADRLPYFLDYYRRLGVDHFYIVDNGSDDATAEILADTADVSVWRTSASYRRARFGTDWLNFLRRRYGHDRWCLTVDADEFLTYPNADTRPLPALTGWLDRSGLAALPALLLDTYPRGAFADAVCRPGDDPLAVASWFDAGNYITEANPRYRNLWIRGGPRARAYFADAADAAPALNKIPLVRWHRSYVYSSATHALLPRRLNAAWERAAEGAPCGCLLHPKFLADFPVKARDTALRSEHFAGGREYLAYDRGLSSGRDGLWSPSSRPFRGWRELERLGLISAGHWA